MKMIDFLLVLKKFIFFGILSKNRLEPTKICRILSRSIFCGPNDFL